MCTLLLINVYLDSVANAKHFIKCPDTRDFLKCSMRNAERQESCMFRWYQRMRTQREHPYYLNYLDAFRKSKLTRSIPYPTNHYIAVFSTSNSIDRIFVDVLDHLFAQMCILWSPFGGTIGIFRSTLCVN